MTDQNVGETGKKERLRKGVADGIKKGWSAYVWLLKILVPVSLLTAVLEFSGVFEYLDFIFIPFTGALDLPPSAVLPIIAGAATGIYGCIASLNVLSLTTGQMTLVALFCLTSHNLIQETVVQAKSGLHPVKALAVRLLASVFLVVIAAWFIDTGSAGQTGSAAVAVTRPVFWGMLGSWLVKTAWLAVQIFIIIMIILVVLELMKTFHLIDSIVRVLEPVLRLMGLTRKSGILWLTAAVFGLSYGGAVIMEEAREGYLDKPDLEKLQMSIGINHAMIEDPFLFLPLGLSAFWLWVPRLLAAMLIVRLFDLWQWLKKKKDFFSHPS